MARMTWALPLAAPILILTSVFLSGSVGAATLMCADRTAVLDRLRTMNGEAPAHACVAANGALLEVTVNPDGNWTAFFTFPDGLTCPVALGEGWRDVPAPDDEPDA